MIVNRLELVLYVYDFTMSEFTLNKISVFNTFTYINSYVYTTTLSFVPNYPFSNYKINVSMVFILIKKYFGNSCLRLSYQQNKIQFIFHPKERAEHATSFKYA